MGTHTRLRWCWMDSIPGLVLSFVPPRPIEYRDPKTPGWIVQRPATHGVDLPEGSELLRTRADGWDHEHCELCNERSGSAEVHSDTAIPEIDGFAKSATRSMWLSTVWRFYAGETSNKESPGNCEVKYCPLCDAEYGESNESCTVCGVDLVLEQLRGQPLDERQRKEKLQVVWRGGDPVAVSEVINILRQAGIRHHVQPSNEHLVFELGMPRPKYAVRIFASDLDAAKVLLANVRESSPFASGIEGVEAAPAALSARRPETPWNPAAANVEVWSGADAAMAELLEACLRENRIGSRREGAEPGALRLLVIPADEVDAREIIREVCEATPPA
jgi:hypothetical protein